MLDEREPRIPQAARFLFGIAGLAVGVTLLLAWQSPGTGRSGLDESVGDATPSASVPRAPDDETPEGSAGTGSDGPREGAVAEGEAGPIVDDGSARAAGVPGFTMPLAEWSYVTDRYGADRGIGFIHGGIDLAVEGLEKSPVYASCPGRVQTSEYSGSYGNYIVVDCGNDWATLYAHLSSVEVAAGDQVTAETVLGRTGSSGFSTGEHLHFEIIVEGKRVNPEHYLDFKIPPGTPLSSGPLYFPGWGEDGPPPTPTNTPTPTATPTDTPIPTATRPPMATETPTPVTPTPKPTNTPTATPEPPTPTATPTSPPVIPG